MGNGQGYYDRLLERVRPDCCLVGLGYECQLFDGLVVLVGCVFERVRYKRLNASVTDPRFKATPERFRDPTSGEVVRVYADPATGERLYVRD